MHGADVNGAHPESMKHLGQALQTNRTYRYVTHVTIGDGGYCKVGPESMKHLGQALQTNHTVTHMTIGGQLLCIVRSGGADAWVCEVANTCVWWCSSQ